MVACRYSCLSFAPATTCEYWHVVAGANERWLYLKPKVMEEIWNLEGSDEDPLHHVCNGVENKWSQIKGQRGEPGPHRIGHATFSQKNVMGWMYRHVAVSYLHIEFDHEGPCTKFGDWADHLIDCDAINGEFVWVNPIIDTAPLGRKGP